MKKKSNLGPSIRVISLTSMVLTPAVNAQEEAPVSPAPQIEVSPVSSATVIEPAPETVSEKPIEPPQAMTVEIQATAYKEGALTEKAVVDSALKNYPVILESLKSLETSEASVTHSLGAFDAKIKSETTAVPKGFYLRRLYDVWVEKLVGTAFNPKVYAGYSFGWPGRFPPQYSTMSTNSHGTPRVGFSISTLRNNLIDSNRGNLKINELSFEQSKKQVVKTRIQIQKESILAFWNWATAGHVVGVFENLLEMAQNRTRVIDERIKRGDISEIIRVENNQYLARRKAEVAQAKNALRQASLNLSLYYRDSEGNPIVPELTALPTMPHPLEEKDTMDMPKDLAHSLSFRPEISMLELENEKLQTSLRLGKNELWPLMDLSMDWTRNYGNDDPTNAPKVWTIQLKIEIPLEYRLGRGLVSQARANLMINDYQKTLVKNTIENEVKKHYSSIQFSRERLVNVETEVSMAERLVEAENIRFKNGASNFYLVNMREEDLANARAGRFASMMEYIQARTEYQAETMKYNLGEVSNGP